ncbi:hypothetical protein EMPS_08272 [Entomortierella parvispora]|uniref:BTB domain-containing protein n=1 Tax=Entomortierella parvispora TaxID=205924 RepID=A0A9P3HFU2_9FUNG|nr:hypothetical protein EMPS_08272 [Entomortierella parvispora]
MVNIMGPNARLESSDYLTMVATDHVIIASDGEDDIYLRSPQDLACQADGPPVSYIAQKWAEILVPHGKTLFGQQDTANCILTVGKSRYFVHWQMLWCRSPTFRRIFDDMTASGVWGSSFGSVADCDNESLGDGREAMLDRLSKELALSTRQSQNEYSHNDDAHNDHSGQDQQNPHSGISAQSNISDQIQETPSLSSSSNEDDSLPELSVALSDPEGSRFEELLYWLYTDDSERWRASFSPQNYSTILENILHLNIASPQVLEICEIYERTTSPILGLHGLAQKTLLPNNMTQFATSFSHGQPET